MNKALDGNIGEVEELKIAARKMRAENERLRSALVRMMAMHEMMMKKINHGASFYDADCLREMNEAPIQAHNALTPNVEVTGLAAASLPQGPCELPGSTQAANGEKT